MARWSGKALFSSDSGVASRLVVRTGRRCAAARMVWLAILGIVVLGELASASKTFGATAYVINDGTDGTVTGSLPYAIDTVNGVASPYSSVIFNIGGTANTGNISFGSSTTLSLVHATYFTALSSGSAPTINLAGGQLTLGTSNSTYMYGFGSGITWQTSGTVLIYGTTSTYFDSISSTFSNSNFGDAVGIQTNGDMIVNTLDGKITATSSTLPGTAVGLLASSTGSLSITTLSGSIVATSQKGSAVDMYGGSVTVNTLSGTLIATASNGNAYGVEAEDYVQIATMSGNINATATGDAAGIISHGSLVDIGNLSGTIVVSGSQTSGIIGVGTVSIGNYTGQITSTGSNLNNSIAYGISGVHDVVINTYGGGITVNAGGGNNAIADGIAGNNVNITTLGGSITVTAGTGASPAVSDVFAASNVSITTLSGTLSATGGGSNSSAQNISANGNISISDFTGTTIANAGNGGSSTAYGLYAAGSISVGNLSGLISVNGGSGSGQSLSGLGSIGDTTIQTLSGTVVAAAGSASAGGAIVTGLATRGNLSIGTLSGLIQATGGTDAASGAACLLSDGMINGGSSNVAMVITGTLSASAGGTCNAIQGVGINVKVADGAALLSNPNGGTYSCAIYDPSATGVDHIELQTGSQIVGSIGLSTSGSNTLTLSAGTSTNSEDLNNHISNANTIDVVGGDWTISGSVSGTNNVNVNSGSLTIAGAISIGGDINVASSGSLALSGATATGVATIAGSLSGVGTIGTLINDGTISPGTQSSIGTLSVTNNFTQGNTGAVNVKVDSSGNCDGLAVNGLALLNGGTVNAIGTTTQCTYAGEICTFLTANSVSGTFGTVTDNQTFMIAELIYGTNYVELHFYRDPNTVFNNAAVTPNQHAVAQYLDEIVDARSYSSGSDMETILNNTLSLDGPGRREAYDAMSGEIHGSMATVAIEGQEMFLRTVAQRLQTQAIMIGYDGCSPARQRWNSQDVCDSDDPHTIGITGWAQGYAVGANIASSENCSALTYSSAGAVVGVEKQFAHSVVGMAGGYANTNVTLDSRGDTGAIDGGQLAFYLRHDFEQFYTTGLFSYGYNSYTTTRYIDFADINRDAYTHHDGSCFSFYTEVGRPIMGQRIHLEPYLALEYIQANQNQFTETDADSIDLAVGGIQASALRGFAGARIFGNYTNKWDQTFTLEGRLAWRHEYLNENRDFDAVFDGQSITSSFTTSGNNVDRDAAVLGFGLGYRIITTLAAYGNYDVTVSDHYTSHSGNVGIQYTW